MLKKTGRVLAFITAIVFIVFSIGGIVGAWWLSSIASDVTLKVFSVVETGIGVVDAGVTRVETLIDTSRTEVQQAEQTITTIASNLQANHPVLTALSTRLETRLGPTVDNVQEAIAPVRDALVSVSNVVSIANSIPFIQEQAPAIDKLDNTLNRLGDTAADVQQLRNTLRAAATGQADQITQETATTLTDLTSRIDARLTEIQANVQEIQAEIEALQVRLQTLKSRLLLIYDLAAILVTLMFLWVIYSQYIVIRHHIRRFRTPAAVAPASGPAAPAEAEAVAPAEIPAAAPLPTELTADPEQEKTG
jgi:predicted  nucleic acid-binding Zn-ribbon protein